MGIKVKIGILVMLSVLAIFVISGGEPGSYHRCQAAEKRLFSLLKR